MAGSLMTSRRFAPLFWCQFFSAFNDNFLKNTLVVLLLFQIGGPGAEALVTLAGAVFIAPFFFLSGLGGQMADRFDKAIIARRLKLVEIAAAGLSALGFELRSVPILFVALGLFGVIAALFGPIKYGILPDHLAREELPAGNALVEAATFLAILAGTITGGLAAAHGGDRIVFDALVMGFALLCWAASLLIPRSGKGAPSLRIDPNILRSTGTLVRSLWGESRLWRGGLIVSWFWLVGAVALSLLPSLVKTTLGGSEEVVTLMLAVFSVGIATGSGLASWLAGGRIVLFPTPIAALVMGGFAIDLAVATAASAPAPSPVGPLAFLASGLGLRATIDLAGLAVGGGLFIVPIFSAVQAWTAKAERARVIGAVNVVSAAFMVAGALVVAGLQGAGTSIPTLFGLLGAANVAAGLLIFRVLPTGPARESDPIRT